MQSNAQAAVAAYPGDGYFISTPVVEVPQSHYEDYYGEPPAPDQLPYVCITTKMTVRFPAPILFFSAKMGNDGTMTFIGSARFQSSRLNYTFDRCFRIFASPGLCQNQQYR